MKNNSGRNILYLHSGRTLVALTGLALLVFIALPLSIAPAAAQSGGGYQLTWSTVDGGGAMNSTGGAYSLSGTIGQPDAGASSAGAYTLVGGFWGGLQSAVSNSLHLFLPLLQKNP